MTKPPEPSRTAEEWESLAIRHRANFGIVPCAVWRKLTGEARERLGILTQEGAQRLIAGEGLDLTDEINNLTPVADRVDFDDLVNNPEGYTLPLDHQYIDIAQTPRESTRRPRPPLTLESLKAGLVAAIDAAGKVTEPIPGYREAVEALPDRTLLSFLPKDIQTFVERELDGLAQGAP